MAATKGDKHPKAGKKMTGKASVGDVSLFLDLFNFRKLQGARRGLNTSESTSTRS